MPRKGYRKKHNGWKRSGASGKRMRKYAIKRMAQPKMSGVTAPINLGNGIPSSCRAALLYSKNMVAGGSLGLASDYVFRGNDLYDPDYTGTGAQPLYFDQLIAMWGYFSVRSSKIDIDCSNDSTVAVSLVVFPSRSSSLAGFTGSNYVQALQVPGAKLITLGPKGSGADVKTISNYCTTNTYYPDYSEANVDFRGHSGASPPSNGAWFWHVFAYPADYGTETVSVACNVKLRYYSTFFSPVVSAFS